MAKFNKDSVSGTVTVVVLLSLVCSIVVSGAAVALKSKQDEQKALDVQRNILTVAGLMKEDNASVIKDTYSKFIEPRLVDLQSGDYVQASAEEINKFEPKDAVKDPAKSQA
ncbi:MAG: Na(+)-translocating NADH-quinone reductase subunit C, partial [Haemophilus parainfluenzae]|nr:Na(+)-translocating NADH-quinone reductase subunit C [Haemophilus parainfluenzae]